MAFLEGTSVTLRPVEESDHEFVQAGVNHPAVRPYVGQRLPTSLAQEGDYLEATNDRDVVRCRRGPNNTPKPATPDGPP